MCIHHRCRYINLVSDGGLTPLHFAAGYLRDRRIDGWTASKLGFPIVTEVEFASDSELEETLRYFLAKKPKLDLGLPTLMSATGNALCTDAVPMLLSQGVSANGALVALTFAVTQLTAYSSGSFSYYCTDFKKIADNTIRLIQSGLDMFITDPRGKNGINSYYPPVMQIVKMAKRYNDPRLIAEMLDKNPQTKYVSLLPTNIPDSNPCGNSQKGCSPFDYCMSIKMGVGWDWPDFNPGTNRDNVCALLK